MIMKIVNVNKPVWAMRMCYFSSLLLMRLPYSVVSYSRIGSICENLAKRIGGRWMRRARYYYIKAMRNGEGAGANNLAACYATGALKIQKNLRRAIELYTLAVNRGCAGAMHNLGCCYYFGEGVNEDKVKASQFFRMASALNFHWAHYYLGLMYLRGEGVGMDKRMALKLIKKAAWSGISNAQYDLAVCYRNGEGVRSRKLLAAFWMLLAALNGCQSAIRLIGRDELLDFLMFKSELPNV